MTCAVSMWHDRTSRYPWYSICATHGYCLGRSGRRQPVEAAANDHIERNRPAPARHTVEVVAVDWSFILRCSICGPLTDDTVRIISFGPEDFESERTIAGTMAVRRAIDHEVAS